MREEERQALERYGEVDAFHLHIIGHLQRARREIQNRLDTRGHGQVGHLLRGRGGDGQHRDADTVAFHDLAQVGDVEDRHAGPRLLADLLALVVEQRGDLEPFLAEARIVGKCEAEVAGAKDGDTQPSIEAEDLTQVPLQVAHVVADAAHPELAEVGEVLADLRRVQVKLFGQCL